MKYYRLKPKRDPDSYPVTVRAKKLSDGSLSLYLDQYRGGEEKRQIIFLNLYIHDGLNRKDCQEILDRAILAAIEHCNGYYNYRVSIPGFATTRNMPDDKNKALYKTYLMLDSNTGLTKIGRSINPKARERTLQSEKPTISCLYICGNDVEKQLHDRFKDKRVRGEWFSLTPEDIADAVADFSFTKFNN